MCSRGVFQLRNVKLQFCDWGGSSKGVRDLLSSNQLDEFLEKNPAITFSAYIRTGAHPCFHTEYINGWRCSIPLLNKFPDEVLEDLFQARNRFGHRSWPHSGAKVISTNPSIQGIWRPNIWGTTQIFEEQRLRKIPEMPVNIRMMPPKIKADREKAWQKTINEDLKKKVT